MNTTNQNREYCKQLLIYTQNFLGKLLGAHIDCDLYFGVDRCCFYFRSSKLHSSISVEYIYAEIKQLCEIADARPRHYERIRRCIEENEPKLKLVEFDPLSEGF